VTISGAIRKDPSANHRASGFVRILLNADQLWPAQGWQEVLPDYDIPTACEITNLRVTAGDKIRFVLKHNGENSPDPIVWDPKIVIQRAERASSR
jgi:hypothetical protein